MAAAVTEANIQDKLDHNTNFAEDDRDKIRKDLEQRFTHATQEREALRDSTNEKILTTRKDILRLREETSETFSANDVQRKVDLMAAVVSEGALRNNMGESLSGRCRTQKNVCKASSHSLNDPNSALQNSEPSPRATYRSLQQL